MTSRLLAGMYLGQIAILDTAGYPMGTLITPNAPVSGTVYSPYVIPALVEFQPSTPTYENAFSYAGQKLRGRRPLGITDYGVGSITLSEMDDVFDALVMGYTVDVTTATNVRARAANALRVQTRRFMLALTTGATPSDSAPNYETIFLLSVYFDKATYRVGQSGGQNPNNLTYNIYVNSALRTPWGQLMSAATVNPDGDADTEMGLYATAPYMFSTYVDDGSAATFTLPYAPSSTEHAGADNIFFKNGVEDKASVSGISGAVVTRTAGLAATKLVTVFPSTAAL